MNPPFSTCISRFKVDGSPSERGEPGPDELRWKRKCRDVARAAQCSAARPLSQPVKLVCRFRVLRSARQHDLDNLLKNLVDAIGAGGFFPAGRSGGPRSEWNTDDGWVFALEATKELVTEQPATEVEVWL